MTTFVPVEMVNVTNGAPKDELKAHFSDYQPGFEFLQSRRSYVRLTNLINSQNCYICRVTSFYDMYIYIAGF